MIRSKRKINKLRGSRSNGGGCTKKRRGAGNKGGRGNAGASKQHWTWTAKFDPDHYGKHGFKRPQKMIKKVNPVNLSYLEEQADNLIESGKQRPDMAPGALHRHATRVAEHIQLTAKLIFKASEQRQRQRQNVALRTRRKAKSMNT